MPILQAGNRHPFETPTNITVKNTSTARDGAYDYKGPQGWSGITRLNPEQETGKLDNVEVLKNPGETSLEWKLSG